MRKLLQMGYEVYISISCTDVQSAYEAGSVDSDTEGLCIEAKVGINIGLIASKFDGTLGTTQG